MNVIQSAMNSMGMTTSTQDWFTAAMNEYPHTPDINRLEHRACWWVFEYGNMQKGHPMHSVIADNSREYGEVYTADKFTLWKRNLGPVQTFPIALDQSPAPQAVRLERLRGRLVNMSTRQIIEMDKYKENGVQFERKRVTVIYSYHELQEVKDPRNTPLMRIPNEWVLPDNIHSFVDEESITPTKGIVDFHEEHEGPRIKTSKILVPKMVGIRVWMWVGVPDYWLAMTKMSKINDAKANGDKKLSSVFLSSARYDFLISPLELKVPNNPLNPKYYYFSKLEYNG